MEKNEGDLLEQKYKEGEVQDAAAIKRRKEEELYYNTLHFVSTYRK